jgi:DNA phosphorothioation-dependent restriction protein DptG
MTNGRMFVQDRAESDMNKKREELQRLKNQKKTEIYERLKKIQELSNAKDVGADLVRPVHACFSCASGKTNACIRWLRTRDSKRITFGAYLCLKEPVMYDTLCVYRHSHGGQQ